MSYPFKQYIDTLVNDTKTLRQFKTYYQFLNNKSAFQQAYLQTVLRKTQVQEIKRFCQKDQMFIADALQAQDFIRTRFGLFTEGTNLPHLWPVKLNKPCIKSKQFAVQNSDIIVQYRLQLDDSFKLYVRQIGGIQPTEVHFAFQLLIQIKKRWVVLQPPKLVSYNQNLLFECALDEIKSAGVTLGIVYCPDYQLSLSNKPGRSVSANTQSRGSEEERLKRMLVLKDKEIAELKRQLSEQQTHKVRDKIVNQILNQPWSTPKRVKAEQPYVKINLFELLPTPPSPICEQSYKDDSLNSLVDLQIITQDYDKSLHLEIPVIKIHKL